MDKKLNIGEETLNLRFKLGVFEHIKEITAIDGIEFLQSAHENIVFGTYVLTLAAAECYRDKWGGEPIDKQRLMSLIKNDGDFSNFEEIATHYANMLGQGEVLTQAKERAKAAIL